MASLYGFDLLVADYIRQQQYSDISAVQLSADLDQIRQAGQPTPAYHVVPATGPIVGDSSPDRTAYRIASRCHVIAAVENPTGQQAIIEQGDLLITRIAALLVGWVPGQGYRQVTLLSPPLPMFQDEFGYFPLTIESEFTFNPGDQ